MGTRVVGTGGEGRGREWRGKGGEGRGKEGRGGRKEHTHRSNYSCSEVAPGGMYSLSPNDADCLA